MAEIYLFEGGGSILCHVNEKHHMGAALIGSMMSFNPKRLPKDTRNQTASLCYFLTIVEK